jgi:hypothetical protein
MEIHTNDEKNIKYEGAHCWYFCEGWIDPNTNQVVLTDRIAQQRAMPQLDTVVGGNVKKRSYFIVSCTILLKC